MVRIAVIVTARASWAKLQTICEALQQMEDVELQIVAAASALLERYGKVIDVIKNQGFTIAAECWSVYEGETRETSAKETGALVSELASILSRLRPECVVVCADRHEVLGAAQAAAYLHVAVAHIQGGESSGSIDHKVRDSITQLADYHFPCTERAWNRVYGLTGALGRIWNFGCSSIDLATRALTDPPVTDAELGGTGPSMSLTKPFGIVLFHPVTNEADQAYAQMQQVLSALDIRIPWICLWPGEDAGSGGISKAIREAALIQPLRTVRNLPPQRFLKLLTQCSVLVGNSSAGIRESSYLGVPVVDIGQRQWGRERAKHVTWVPPIASEIGQAIRDQIAHGTYPSDRLYGDGNAGQQIAEVLRHVGAGTDTGSEGVEGLPGKKLTIIRR